MSFGDLRFKSRESSISTYKTHLCVLLLPQYTNANNRVVKSRLPPVRVLDKCPIQYTIHTVLTTKPTTTALVSICSVYTPRSIGRPSFNNRRALYVTIRGPTLVILTKIINIYILNYFKSILNIKVFSALIL